MLKVIAMFVAAVLVVAAGLYAVRPTKIELETPRAEKFVAATARGATIVAPPCYALSDGRLEKSLNGRMLFKLFQFNPRLEIDADTCRANALPTLDRSPVRYEQYESTVGLPLPDGYQDGAVNGIARANGIPFGSIVPKYGTALNSVATVWWNNRPIMPNFTESNAGSELFDVAPGLAVGVLRNGHKTKAFAWTSDGVENWHTPDAEQSSVRGIEPGLDRRASFAVGSVIVGGREYAAVYDRIWGYDLPVGLRVWQLPCPKEYDGCRAQVVRPTYGTGVVPLLVAGTGEKDLKRSPLIWRAAFSPNPKRDLILATCISVTLGLNRHVDPVWFESVDENGLFSLEVTVPNEEKAGPHKATFAAVQFRLPQ